MRLRVRDRSFSSCYAILEVTKVVLFDNAVLNAVVVSSGLLVESASLHVSLASIWIHSMNS